MEIKKFDEEKIRKIIEKINNKEYYVYKNEYVGDIINLYEEDENLLNNLFSSIYSDYSGFLFGIDNNSRIYITFYFDEQKDLSNPSNTKCFDNIDMSSEKNTLTKEGKDGFEELYKIFNEDSKNPEWELNIESACKWTNRGADRITMGMIKLYKKGVN